jgi:hypothetical protein
VVRSVAEIDAAITDMGRVPGTGLVSPPDALTFPNRRPVVDGVARANLPAVYSYTEFVEDGA